jgi:hypothetical protein
MVSDGARNAFSVMIFVGYLHFFVKKNSYGAKTCELSGVRDFHFFEFVEAGLSC